MRLKRRVADRRKRGIFSAAAHSLRRHILGDRIFSAALLEMERLPQRGAMKIARNDDRIFFASQTPSSLILAAVFISIAIASILCAAGKYREATAATLATLTVGYVLSARLSVESILIFWFATSPLASFYIRFPFDKSIITYNRAALALAVAMLISNRGSNQSAAYQSGIYQSATEGQSASGFSATKFEIMWALLSIIALASALISSEDTPYAAKLAVDSFILPLAAFHLSRHHFHLRGRKRALLYGTIALALFLFATGSYEFATGTNLFQYTGSELVREGERRANGPFAADSSYATISLLLALFLQALPRVLRLRLDRTTRLIYSLAVAAAMLAALLPLFRATAIALIVCLLILKAGAGKRARRREDGEAETASAEFETTSMIQGRLASSLPRLRVSAATLSLSLVAIAIAVIIAGMSLGYFSSARRLADPRNAFGRLATWRAAAGIATENPIFGVGLANYPQYFRAKYEWENDSAEAVLDARAANSPHSNLLWVAAELGGAAFLLYAAANFYLVSMGWRAFKNAKDAPARAAAACCLALFAAYWIHGTTLSSGYYSDLNLYFFFMSGLLSNKSVISHQ
jgi:O-antigen ligase